MVVLTVARTTVAGECSSGTVLRTSQATGGGKARVALLERGTPLPLPLPGTGLVARLEEGIAEHIDSINYCLNVVWWSLKILSLHFVGSGEGLGTFCSEPLKVIRFCKLGHCKKHGGLKIYQGNKLIRDSGNLRNVKY